MFTRILKSPIPRFIIIGAVAAGINLAVLFLLTHYFALWYLASSLIAFSVSFFINFYFQKHWVFKNTDERIRRQITAFFTNSIINLALNTILLAFFVEVVGVWYIVGQIVTTGVIAVYNFFVYKKFVFVSSK